MTEDIIEDTVIEIWSESGWIVYSRTDVETALDFVAQHKNFRAVDAITGQFVTRKTRYLSDEQMDELESLVDNGAGLYKFRTFIEGVLNA